MAKSSSSSIRAAALHKLPPSIVLFFIVTTVIFSGIPGITKVEASSRSRNQRQGPANATVILELVNSTSIQPVDPPHGNGSNNITSIRTKRSPNVLGKRRADIFKRFKKLGKRTAPGKYFPCGEQSSSEELIKRKFVFSISGKKCVELPVKKDPEFLDLYLMHQKRQIKIQKLLAEQRLLTQLFQRGTVGPNTLGVGPTGGVDPTAGGIRPTGSGLRSGRQQTEDTVRDSKSVDQCGSCQKTESQRDARSLEDSAEYYQKERRKPRRRGRKRGRGGRDTKDSRSSESYERGTDDYDYQLDFEVSAEPPRRARRVVQRPRGVRYIRQDSREVQTIRGSRSQASSNEEDTRKGKRVVEIVWEGNKPLEIKIGSDEVQTISTTTRTPKVKQIDDDDKEDNNPSVNIRDSKSLSAVTAQDSSTLEKETEQEVLTITGPNDSQTGNQATDDLRDSRQLAVAAETTSTSDQMVQGVMIKGDETISKQSGNSETDSPRDPKSLDVAETGNTERDQQPVLNLRDVEAPNESVTFLHEGGNLQAANEAPEDLREGKEVVLDLRDAENPNESVRVFHEAEAARTSNWAADGNREHREVMVVEEVAPISSYGSIEVFSVRNDTVGGYEQPVNDEVQPGKWLAKPIPRKSRATGRVHRSLKKILGGFGRSKRNHRRQTTDEYENPEESEEYDDDYVVSVEVSNEKRGRNVTRSKLAHRTSKLQEDESSTEIGNQNSSKLRSRPQRGTSAKSSSQSKTKGTPEESQQWNQPNAHPHHSPDIHNSNAGSAPYLPPHGAVPPVDPYMHMNPGSVPYTQPYSGYPAPVNPAYDYNAGHPLPYQQPAYGVPPPMDPYTYNGGSVPYPPSPYYGWAPPVSSPGYMPPSSGFQ